MFVAKRGRPVSSPDMSGGLYIYSKELSREQHRYGADADWIVLDGSVHMAPPGEYD